jgi:hypothetical protein
MLSAREERFERSRQGLLEESQSPSPTEVVPEQQPFYIKSFASHSQVVAEKSSTAALTAQTNERTT